MPADATTVAQPATSKPAQPRAPKGGMVDARTGRYYRGGCFIPLCSTPADVAACSPAPLVGSSRQVIWATRLRSGWLDRLDSRLADLRARLDDAGRVEAAGIRAEVKRVECKRWRVARESDAATIVGRHVSKAVCGLRLAVCA